MINKRDINATIWREHVEDNVGLAVLGVKYGVSARQIGTIVRTYNRRMKLTNRYVVGTGVTRDTLISNLIASKRLVNHLIYAKKHLYNTGEPAIVGDFVDMADADFLRLHNIGQGTLIEWKSIVRHIQYPEEFSDEEPKVLSVPMPVDVGVNRDERTAEGVAAEIHATLNVIASMYVNMAHAHRKLANLLAPRKGKK
jgi:hypothetical protein